MQVYQTKINSFAGLHTGVPNTHEKNNNLAYRMDFYILLLGGGQKPLNYFIFKEGPFNEKQPKYIAGIRRGTYLMIGRDL